MSKTFDRAKLDEDLEIGVRGLYQNNGYFKVLVKDPILKTVDVNRGGSAPSAAAEWGASTARRPISSFPSKRTQQYHMGRLVIRSADPDKGLSLKREYLESMFPLKKGDIFDADKIRKAIETYTKLYGVYGYIDFTATPQIDAHDDTKTIDLTFDFDEQKQFFVRRIEFSGKLDHPRQGDPPRTAGQRRRYLQQSLLGTELAAAQPAQLLRRHQAGKCRDQAQRQERARWIFCSSSRKRANSRSA